MSARRRPLAGAVVRGLARACALTLTVMAGACGEPPACDLCTAVSAADAAKVTAVLRAGVPDGPERSRAVTLAMALEAACTDWHQRLNADQRAIVLALIEAGVDVNVSYTVTSGERSTNRSSRIVYASEAIGRWGDLALLERVLAKGLDVKGHPGGRALTAAAGAGHVAVVQRLIDLGADVNYPHPRLGGPLAAAIHERRRDVLPVLDARGAREW